MLQPRWNLFALALIVVAGCAAAPPQSPGERIAQAERSDADRERDSADKPGQVLAFLGIEPGMQVADLFAGGGYYSELLSLAVGETGQVIAYNNGAYHRFGGEQTAARFDSNRLANVRYLVAEADQLSLPANLDAAIMIMSFHDLYWVNEEQGWPKMDARQFLGTVFDSLKSGGVLGVVDHHAVAGSGIAAVSPLHRIDRAFVVAELQAVGFRLSADSDLLRNPADDRSQLVFDPAIRRQTDRFILRFVKP